MVALASNVSSTIDSVVASQVARALRERDANAFHGVDVRSELGIVTLSGSVPSWYARSLAYQVARRQTAAGQVVDALLVRQST